jgi:hypothetical protein
VTLAQFSTSAQLASPPRFSTTLLHYFSHLFSLSPLHFHFTFNHASFLPQTTSYQKKLSLPKTLDSTHCFDLPVALFSSLRPLSSTRLSLIKIDAIYSLHHMLYFNSDIQLNSPIH